MTRYFLHINIYLWYWKCRQKMLSLGKKSSLSLNFSERQASTSNSLWKTSLKLLLTSLTISKALTCMDPFPSEEDTRTSTCLEGNWLRDGLEYTFLPFQESDLKAIFCISSRNLRAIMRSLNWNTRKTESDSWDISAKELQSDLTFSIVTCFRLSSEEVTITKQYISYDIVHTRMPRKRVLFYIGRVLEQLQDACLDDCLLRFRCSSGC